MATEEFKLLSEELFDNYVELKNKMKDQGHENVNLAFKEYLEFYIQYEKIGLDIDYEDLDDSSEEDEE